MDVDSTNSFVTLAEVRAYLDLEDTDTSHNETLEALINQSAGLFNAYTGRKLKARQYTDHLFHSSGGDVLYLPEFPVDASQPFSIYAADDREFGDALTYWSGSGSSTDLQFMFSNDFDSMIRIDGDYWPYGWSTVRVTMFAGLQGADAEPIKHAQLRQVAAWYYEIGRDPALNNWSMGGVSQGLQRPERDLVPDVKAILFGYRPILV